MSFYSSASGSAFTTSGLPRSNNEATKEHPKWSSPGYPARSLEPAYKPTELHNQRTPPRLILDDDGSDLEDRRSIESGRIVNLGDDENLSDILNSDDERAFRPSSVSSHFSKGITNPGFIEEINMDETAGEPYKMRRKSQSPSLANGSEKLSVNMSDVPEERKASIISSDLSLGEGERTVFLPVKKEKKIKKQEKPKKSKTTLLSANTDKNLRRGSVTPVNEDNGTRVNSATQAKSPWKSPTLQVTEGEKRRKSITNTTDNDRKVITPRDTYAKGKKTTKVSTLENGPKSVVNEELDVGKTGVSGKVKNGRSITPASPHQRKNISIVASGGDDEVSEGKQKRITATSATPFNERRKSTVADVEQRESSRGNESRLKEMSTSPANKQKNSTVADDGKRKKKKQKNDKEKKKKKKTVDSEDSSEETTAHIIEDSTGLNVTPASPGTQRRPSAVLQEKETKVKKKKKRKDREEKKRKTEDSELSGEEEADEGKTKHLDVDGIAVPDVETKRRKSVVPDETQKKKKKQNEATTTRRKSEIPTAKHRDQDTNGFVHSAKSLRMDSLTVTPEEKRRKSIVIEDIESKSQTSDTSSRRKSVIPDIPTDWKRSGPDQNIARMQPNSISPIPTGNKSPRLIIKPSYHKY